jgi:hypothetical protein
MRTFFFFLIISSSAAFGQVEINAAMGIDFINSPSLSDYISQNYETEGDGPGSFFSAIDFSLEGGYYISGSYFISAEGAFLLNSYTTSGILGQYELSYNIIMPSLMNYFVISGIGYNFKLGGGIGPRFVSADESLPGTGVTKNYRSTGFGIVLRAEGNTLLTGNIYANIAAQFRYDANGEPEYNCTPLVNNVLMENVSFNSLSVGVSLGVTYQL